mgnify:CR=1 FL=1
MTCPTEKRTLLTLITEATIESSLLRDLDRLGVRGYTVSDARGRGSRGACCLGCGMRWRCGPLPDRWRCAWRWPLRRRRPCR